MIFGCVGFMFDSPKLRVHEEATIVTQSGAAPSIYQHPLANFVQFAHNTRESLAIWIICILAISG